MSAEEQVTARPAQGVKCEGCEYQAKHKRRTHINDADYLCDNCQRPLCIGHINYERRGDWWLCAPCFGEFGRKTREVRR